CRVFSSSRRQHTRSKRDWSSDACSADLPPPSCPPTWWPRPRRSTWSAWSAWCPRSKNESRGKVFAVAAPTQTRCAVSLFWLSAQIGRESCRERDEYVLWHVV